MAGAAKLEKPDGSPPASTLGRGLSMDQRAFATCWEVTLATAAHARWPVGRLTITKNTAPGKSLGAKVQQIQGYVAANDTADACAGLNGFISLVNAQKGKKLTNAQVTSYIAQATAIKTTLGC